MRVLWLIIILLLTSVAEARLRRVGFEGTRPLGMGNAFIALADDQNALWYNPAALANVEGMHAHLMDYTLGVDSLDTLGKLTDSILSGDFDSNVRTDTQSTRLNVAPAFITPYFGFSIYANSDTFMDIQDLLSNNVDIVSNNDLGVMVAFGLPIGKMFSIGVSTRLFMRFGIDEFLTPAELLAKLGGIPAGDFLTAAFTELSNDVTEGYALGVNVGALATLPFTSRNLKWTVGATIDDFANTSFTSLSGATAPNSINSTVNFGTAFQYKLSRKQTLNLTIDWRDFFGSDPLFKRLHLGLELNFSGFSLRTGLYQARPSLGFSFNALPHTRVNFTTWGAELGDDVWQREHRRYLLQIIIGFTPL